MCAAQGRAAIFDDLKSLKMKESENHIFPTQLLKKPGIGFFNNLFGKAINSQHDADTTTRSNTMMMQSQAFSRIRTLGKVSAMITAVSALSGCLITTPYWNQEFSSHSSAIPIQVWTHHSPTTVRVQCTQAFHGGLYPAFEEPVWQNLTNLTPQLPGVLDGDGARVYSAGTTIVIPESCWHSEVTSSGLRYYTAVRVIQQQPKIFGSGTQDVTFNTFDKTGLECLGRENGKAASWFGYINKNCVETYSGSSTPIPYVIFRAKS
jgi:hypothetical protein